MVQQGLIEYIQNLLRQGYDVGTIRTTLINAGYSPSDVNVALRAAGAKSRHISTKVLVVVFVALVVLSGVVLLALKLMQPPAEPLTFSLSLFSSVVEPGGEVVVTSTVVSPGGRRVSGLIDFVVKGPGGRVVSQTSEFEVETRTNVPVTLSLPDAAQQGSYVVEATLSYAGGKSVQSVSFEVAEEVEVAAPVESLEEEADVVARETQLTCPAGCDDLDFCTADSCVEGQCVNAPIVPCCGNRVCESGESESSCAIDCGERLVVDDVRERAVAEASSSLSAAMSECDTLAQRELVDGCLLDVSKAAQSKEPCREIVGADKRDACLIVFAYEDDFSVCEEITNKYMRKSCESLRQLQQTT